MSTARFGVGFALYWAAFAVLSLAVAHRCWGAVALIVLTAAVCAARVLSSGRWSGSRVRPRTVSSPPTAG